MYPVPTYSRVVATVENIYATVLGDPIHRQVQRLTGNHVQGWADFSELPGDRHGVSANASNTKPAKLLAVFVLRRSCHSAFADLSVIARGQVLRCRRVDRSGLIWL